MAIPLKNSKSKTKFLPDGQSIRREVKRIFKSERGRRVALVAFVGKSADAYLPRPKGLELICWPQAPGTNPAVVEELMKKRKVHVQFADRLHMKIYWTAKHGAVVTSANLSTNAYGRGALHEAGVLLSSDAINIDDVIESVNPRDVTPRSLAKLRTESRRVQRTQTTTRGRKTFLDWLKKPERTPWKLHCFREYGGGACGRLREAAKEETGSTRVEDWIYCRKGDVKAEDYILSIDLASRRKPVSDDWLFVHRVVLVAKKDKRYDSGWPYQAGQLHPSTACPQPPFYIDGYFHTALRSAYKALGSDAEKEFFEVNTRRPSKRLLKLIEKNYRSAARS